MPVLARAWQMLLKGHDEVRSSPRPLAAADMVLVRLAYVVDLPPPGEVARQPNPDTGEATSKARATTPPKGARVTAQAAHAEPIDVESENPAPPDFVEAPDPEPVSEAPMPQSFADVVDLADIKRDLKLKNALLEQVRLVHFKPGDIALNPLPLAAPDLLQELMRKLKSWTGRVWIVSTSEQEGEEPLGVQRRAAEALEIEALKAHPAVQEVLRHFPGAEIKDVRNVAEGQPDTDNGSDSIGDDNIANRGGSN